MSGYDGAEDRALLAAIADGEEAAFDAFYQRHEKGLYRFIQSKLNDPFESADLFHEVLMEVWRAAARFEGRSTVKTWMYGIAYRKVMDRFRKTRRETLTDDPPEQVDDSACPLDIVEERDVAAHIRHCLDELSVPHRTVIELTFYQELNYREIADVIDCPEGTVKTRAFHAKQLLKRCVSGRLGEQP